MNHRIALLQALVHYLHESRAPVVAGAEQTAPAPEVVDRLTDELVSRTGALALAARRKRAAGVLISAVLVAFSLWGIHSDAVAYWLQYVGAVLGFVVLILQLTQTTRAIDDSAMIERLLRATLTKSPERLQSVVELLIEVLNQP